MEKIPIKKHNLEEKITYSSSGVDIERANNLIENIKPIVKKTQRPGADTKIGGFGGIFDIGLLNYNDPVLTPMVSRQIMTNFMKRGINIDFVVTWGYEYTANAYRIGFSEFHSGKPPKHNLPELAKKVGIWGGTARQGGGSRYVGNAYVLKDKDFWSLFTRNKVV